MSKIVADKGLVQVTDTSAIEPLCDAVIADNPKQVQGCLENPKAVGWFVGQVMKASGGKANPQMVKEILERKLGEPD